MQFIERLFGIAPDGGSGILEICLILIPLVVAILAAVWGRRAKSDPKTL